MKKQIHMDFDQNGTLQEKNFELFYINNLSGIDMKTRSHDFYEFTFFLNGKVSICIENTEYSLFPGHVLLLPPRTVHHVSYMDSDTPYASFIIIVSKEYFGHLLERTNDYGYILSQTIRTKNYLYHLDPATFKLLQNKIFHLLEEQNTERFGKSEQVTVYFHDLILTLNRIVYELAHPKEKEAERTLAHDLAIYIEQNLKEEISLDLLAKQFFVSKYHISHIFKDTFCVTLHQYLTKKRLELVRASLLGNEDISNKYMDYGFKDYSGLFRAFKKEYGMSPKEYQKQYAIRRDL